MQQGKTFFSFPDNFSVQIVGFTITQISSEIAFFLKTVLVGYIWMLVTVEKDDTPKQKYNKEKMKQR